MTTTVATAYGNWWLLSGTGTQVATWLGNNDIPLDRVILVFDDTDQTWEGLVRYHKTGLAGTI